MSGALEGIKVVDLSRILAGPYCGQMLSDLGAEVVKVEAPWGDDTRTWGPPFLDDGTAAYHLSCNRGKSFIQAKITGHSSGETSDFYSIEKVAAIMPQQEPFLFLEQANLSNRSAEGRYTISGNETFLEGHFKGNPVFPASIMLEALGQLAVFALLKNPPEEIKSAIDMKEVYFAGVDGVRCHRVCRPGEILDMSIAVKRVREPLAVFSGQISVGGKKAVVAEEITLAFKPVDHHSNGAGNAVSGVSVSNGSELSRNGAR